MRAKTMLLAVALAVAAAQTPAMPLEAAGGRLGCLIVTNSSSSAITLHVVGRFDDGDWTVPGESTWILNGLGQDQSPRNIVVDENTLVWSTTGTITSPKRSLMEGPDTAYHPQTGRTDCENGAAWYLALGAPISQSAAAVTAPAPIAQPPQRPAAVPNAPPPAAAPRGPSAVVNRYAITPGVGIGAVRLGMGVVSDIVPILGPWTSGTVNPDGTLSFRWYSYSTDSNGAHHGGGVNATERNGAVIQISVYHAPEYVIDGLSTGATEAQVRAALGDPARVTSESPNGPSEAPDKVLWYDGVSFWISETPNDPDGDYGKVFEIRITPRATSAAPIVTAPQRIPIVPGVGIGSVRLGMNVVKDVVPLLGPWKYSTVNPDGTLFFRWYDFSTDPNGAHHGSGLNVLARNGAVVQVSVYHAPDYAVGSVATGMTEAEVRAALGAPLRVTTESSTESMLYRGVNVWISKAPSDPDGDYGKVFQITVVPQ